MLGICLGHQAIGEVFGGRVVRTGEVIHGKTSPLHHTGTGLYQGLPQNIPIGRYHSLIIDRSALPDCLAVTSELADGMIMGVRHKKYPIEGIQFHPESILTPDGRTMMQNFLAQL
jgi:anthranilate synthase/aminodeoxychorismate synthase-like glutamine amidotransferase